MSLNRAARTAFLAVLTAGAASAAEERVTVAYFLEWPTPSQFGQVTDAYDAALGVPVDWRAYASGTEMSAALAAGEAQIAYSQGAPPFVVAVSSGQDLKLVDIAVSYSENDNCVVRRDLGVDKSNLANLAGASVVLPLGSAAHYGFLKQMTALGVDVATMSIADMTPADAAAAFADGDYDMACAWGGALRAMLAHGDVLLSGPEKEALGIYVFDATVVSGEFLRTHPEQVAAFVATTAAMNAAYADDAEAMLDEIAKAAEMDRVAAKETLDGFTFLSVDEQLSPAWLGGGAQTFLKEVAEFMTAQGQILEARGDYHGVVEPRFLEALTAD